MSQICEGRLSDEQILINRGVVLGKLQIREAVHVWASQNVRGLTIDQIESLMVAIGLKKEVA